MAFIKNIFVLFAVILCAKAIPFVYLRDNGAEIYQPLQPYIPVIYFSNVNAVSGASFVQYPQYPVVTSTFVTYYPSIVQYAAVQQPIVANNGYISTNQITNSQIVPVEINLPANC